MAIGKEMNGKVNYKDVAVMKNLKLVALVGVSVAIAGCNNSNASKMLLKKQAILSALNVLHLQNQAVGSI